MKQSPLAYSHELVELGNQAWILNCALAELHRFSGVVAAEAGPDSRLQRATGEQLDPAIGRLRLRLEALISKWQRRMVETGSEPPVIRAQPWGVRLAVPEAVRAQLQVCALGSMPPATLEQLAATEPERLFICHQPGEPADSAAPRADQPLVVYRFGGVALSCSKMWWCWWFERQWPLCRAQVVGDNLWQADGCGGVADLTASARCTATDLKLKPPLRG